MSMAEMSASADKPLSYFASLCQPWRTALQPLLFETSRQKMFRQNVTLSNPDQPVVKKAYFRGRAGDRV